MTPKFGTDTTNWCFMKIGILQCGHPSDLVIARHGEFADMFARLLSPGAFEFVTWNVVDMEFPDGPEQADGWLITGSKHGAYDDLPFIPPLEDLIRAIRDSGKPMVGICFGHQIIAQAFGGHVEKFKGGWSVGAKTYDWPGLGPVNLTAWHQDQVIRPPDGAVTLASNDFCAHAALAYGDRILTVQPHPEFSRDVTKSYVEAKTGDPVYPEGVVEAAGARLSTPLQSDLVAQRLIAVLKGATHAE